MREKRNGANKLLSFRLGDLLVLCLILLLALGLGLAFLPKAADRTVRVEIYQDGQLVEAVPLSQDRTVRIDGEYTNVVVIRDGTVWMDSSDCPGADCVHSGAVSSPGRAIVCLPNRVEIRLVGGESPVDIAVG